jgi:hypothetical protein
MQSPISSSLIARLSPAARPFEIRDTRLRGFLLRVQPSGVMTYYVEYARGKRVVIGPTALTSLDQARANAKTRSFALADRTMAREPS